MRKLFVRLTKWNLSIVTLAIAETVLILLLIGGCRLYRRWDRIFGEDAWTLTQYGPRDINSQFYTLYNPRRGLIVVDGGWYEDEAYVRTQIRRLGGVVDAWIITHPHQDHAGAFNAIWPDKKDIQIRMVYTVPMASPADCLAVAPWDSTEVYEAFMALPIPQEQIRYVSAGDTCDLLGLNVEIFSAFDEHVRELSRDYLNDGSMMFKVTGPEKSILFCADVGKSMSKYLRKKWGDKLQADYVQMGHHGNGGLKENFYRTVSAEAAFFDAPDWLLHDETGTYNTPQKLALMEELGCAVYAFNTAPNELPL